VLSAAPALGDFEGDLLILSGDMPLVNENLAYGDHAIEEPGLIVPHPGIASRNFVLLPLREIAPDFQIPGLGRVRDLPVNGSEPRISRIA
jgi:hypothetical protein